MITVVALAPRQKEVKKPYTLKKHGFPSFFDNVVVWQAYATILIAFQNNLNYKLSGHDFKVG